MGAYGEYSSWLRNFGGGGFKLVTNLKETKEAKCKIIYNMKGNGSFRSYSRSDPASFRSYSLSVRSFRPDFWGESFRPNFGGSFRPTLFFYSF